MAVRRFSSEMLQAGDEPLARLVTSGSDQAFSALYERYHDVLYRYCRSILLHEADAHDAVQSTFIRALEALRHGRRDAPLRPWLFRIAHNESISIVRRRKKARALHSELGPLSIGAEDHAEHRELVVLLLDDLQELPARQRGAIVMRELAGLSHEEIATALRTSVSGARQAIFEARGALSEFAAGRAMACEDVRSELSDGDRRVLRRRPIRAHLRDCAACAAFAATLPERRVGLGAVLVPIMAAPARVLARLFGWGLGSGSGADGFLAAAASDIDAGALAAKPVAAVVAVLAAMAGGGTLISSVSGGPTTRPARSTARVAEAAMSSSRISSGAVGTNSSGRSTRRARGVDGSRAIAGVSRPMGATGGAPSSARQSAPTRAGRGKLTTAESTPSAPVSGQSAARGGGAAGQTVAQGGNVNAGPPAGGAITGSGGGSGTGGGGGSGTGGSGAPPGQTKPRGGPGNGNVGQPPGQTKAKPGGGGNGAGNSGQPPGQTKAKPGGGGNGAGNSGQPPGQAKPGAGNSGRPSGQAKPGAGGNGGQPPGQAKPGAGGNGNSGQPPGQTVAQAQPGPSSQPSGPTNTPAANGNSGHPPGQAGGNGNGGQPPGQTSHGNGNGNPHQPSRSS